MNSIFTFAPACGGDLGKLKGNMYRVHATVSMAELASDSVFISTFEEGDTLQIETLESNGLYEFQIDGSLKKYIKDNISSTNAILTSDKDLTGASISAFEDILSITIPSAGKYLLIANFLGYALGDDTAINIKVTKNDNTDVSTTIHLCDIKDNGGTENFEHYESAEVTCYIDVSSAETFKIRASQSSDSTQQVIKATHTKLTSIRLV